MSVERLPTVAKTMINARLTLTIPNQREREIELSGDASIGRAADNSIAIDNASISRYHAIIERRANGYWISGLKSVNSTLVNGEPITNERKLRDGDQISIGIAKMGFHFSESPQPANAGIRALPSAPSTPSLPDRVIATPATIAPPAAATQTKTAAIIIAISVAVIAIVAILIVINPFKSHVDEISARIISPPNGSTIREPIKVVVEVKNSAGIDRVIYQLDGIEFASATLPPYDTVINPAQLITRFPSLTTSNHVLSLTLESADGSRKPQSETVLLAFEIERAPEAAGNDSTTTGQHTAEVLPQTGSANITMLAQTFASQITQKSGYQFDAQFINMIERSVEDYRFDATIDARRYRREVIKAFRDKGLHPLIGFVLAISESKFRNEPNSKEGIGLWRIPPRIAQAYLLPGENEAALTDPKRAAEVTAAYLKDLFNVFGIDNFIFVVGCYGLPLDQAGNLRTRLETMATGADQQREFWRMIESGQLPPQAAKRVARFFAAGIVAENPQLFGLQSQPISSLY